MPKVRNFQSSFNSGVLDPRFKARVDIKAFYQAAEQLDNALCLPHGGVTRRPGLEYLSTLPKQVTRFTGQTITAPRGGTTANANDGSTSTELVTTTNISTLDPYIVVHYDLGSAQTIIFADAVGMKLTTSANTEFFIQYSTDNSAWTSLGDALSLSSTDSTSRRTGPISAQYWRIARIGTTDLTTQKATLDEFNVWTESTALSDYQLIPFSFNTEQQYLLVASDRNLRVIKDDALLVDVRIPHVSANIGTLRWTQSADTLIMVQKDVIYTQVLRDSTSEGIWVVSDLAVTNNPQYDFGSGAEDTWSATRGYPLTCTFFEGRFIFGGSKSRPQSIWMTKTNDYYNFDLGTSLPDESIQVTLDTDQVNEIRHLNPGRKLEIVTSGGEFVVPGAPMTPEDISIRRQTSFGASQVPIASVDGSTIYVQRNGQGLREMLFSFTEDAYVSNSISQLSSHLINTPVDIDAIRGTTTEETNYVYVINTAGDVVVFNTLREQEIAAWSGPWTTTDSTADSSFKRVGVVDTDSFFVVERQINGSSVSYLEKLNPDIYMDSAYSVSSHSSATVTGLDHLEGELVQIKLNGAVQTSQTVSSGAITLTRTPSSESVEVGLAFNPTIKTMPISSQFADGQTRNKMKRIVKVMLNCYETLGVIVNGERIADRTFGVDNFNDVPMADDETREIYLLGWDYDPTITITQDEPVPLTVLAIDGLIEA